MDENINLEEILEILELLELSIIEYENTFNSGKVNNDLVHIIFRHAHNLKSYLFTIDKKYSSELIHLIEANFDLIRKSKATYSHDIIEQSLLGVETIKSNLQKDEDINTISIISNKLDSILKYYSSNINLSLKIVDLELTQNEYDTLKNIRSNNTNIYQIDKLIKSNILEEDYNNLFIYDDIKEIGTYITTIPKFNAINKTKTEDVLKIFFASEMNEEQISMYIFDPVSKIKINITKVDGDEPLITNSLVNKYLSDLKFSKDIIELKLLDLENDLTNSSLITEIKGHIHNIKGNSGLFEFYFIEDICSELEDIFNENKLDKEKISYIFSKIDLIDTFINEFRASSFYIQEDNLDNEVENQKKEINNISDLNQIIKKDIRVETIKLDKLFDLVGELITVESMLNSHNDVKKIKSLSFRKVMSILNKVSREIQEITMSIRMIPIEIIFNRTKKILRDLSLKTGKKVDIEISGYDTEIDKNIIEMISDPLMHLVRNAIDHGIEKEEERLLKNKPIQGLLKLNAGYEGNEIFITIEDDGKGLDREKIINKAITNGLANDEINNLSDSDVWKYIFEAGFSTAEEVSQISGRGVGLDVVKRNIEKVQGKIEVSSNKYKGTLFKLRIPLTLAIIDGFLVKIGNGYFVLPIMLVNKSIKVTSNQITSTMDGQEVIKIKEDIFKIIRLHEFFNIEENKNSIEDGIIIILEYKNQKVGFFVDEIIGQQQIVVKSFDSYIGSQRGMSGCTILGNGDIGFILDVDSILDFVCS